jgi:hypothetical protein
MYIARAVFIKKTVFKKKMPKWQLYCSQGDTSDSPSSIFFKQISYVTRYEIIDFEYTKYI